MYAETFILSRFFFPKTEKFLSFLYLDKHYDKWSGGRNKVAIKAIKSGLCCVGLIKGGNFVGNKLTGKPFV